MLKNQLPVIFRTKNGNFYIFDNGCRIVLPANKYSDSFALENDEYIIRDIKILDEIKKDFPRLPLFTVPDYHEARSVILSTCGESLRQKGINQLILMVTEECNFRCNYCIYSENYSYTRSHNSKKMNWETAKEAIDFFFSYNTNALKYNPTLNPSVGFYGGEPLINWEIIKKSVIYIEENYRNVFTELNYSITTNGSLLNDSIIDFMIEKKFSINISIDGYKNNHDRNRRYISGKTTYEDVIAKVSKIDKKKTSGASQIDDLPYHFVMTYDNETSIEQLNEEAKRDPIFYSHFARMSKVRNIKTTYYQNQSSDQEQNTIIQNILWRIATVSSLSYSKIERILFNQNTIIPAFNVQFVPNVMGGTCMPGDKLAINSYGDFYICEKIDYQSKIGNIKTGFDYSKQREYLEKYFKIRDKHCSQCNLSNICSLCFSQCSSGGDSFEINEELCRRMKKSISKAYSIYYTALENGIYFHNEKTY